MARRYLGRFCRGTSSVDQEAYRATMRATDEIVYAVRMTGDPLAGEVEFVSPKVRELFGYEPEEFMRDSELWLRSVHPDDIAALAETTDALCREGKPIPRTYRFRHKLTREYRWVEDIPIPRQDASGRITGLLGVARDITERMQAEQQIRSLNEALEQKVRERTAELEAANAELEAFSSSVSHDLRAPLRAIEGYAQLLLEHQPQQLDAEGRRFLGTIVASTKRMGEIIEDLLALSQLGRQALRKSRVDLTALARGVVDEIAEARPDRCVAVTIGELPAALCDRSMMRQVLVNLIGNAFKFTRHRDRPVVEIGAREEAEENVYFVRDNGVGFDLRYSNRLFGVFQRLHRPEEFEGTGVGLAIVDRVIRRHGGRVWAEGEVDKGATFYFSLPKPEEEAR
jgi:PAS domain S-box-containing protein